MKNKTRTPAPNLRQDVIRAAEQADVPLDEWDRAQVLGQIAGLIAKHPRVGGMIAFKGGAIMHLIDKSPRLSKDLDASLIAGGRVDQETIRQALSTLEARKIVISVGELVSLSSHSITFPVITCHPLSGKDRVYLHLSINWLSPLLCVPERREVLIRKRVVSFLVVARIERIAEKIRAFLMRDRPSDAFDLYHYAKQGISEKDRAILPRLIATKLREDEDAPKGVNLHALFDRKVSTLSGSWSKAALVIAGNRPTWAEVGPRVKGFKRYIPQEKPR